MARSAGLSALGGHDLSLSASGGLYPALATSSLSGSRGYEPIPQTPSCTGLEKPLSGQSGTFTLVHLPIQQPPGFVRPSPAIETSVVLSQTELGSTPGAAHIVPTLFVLQHIYVPGHR
jgi:hypothetical protein